MTVLNIGSINWDRVYSVPRFPQPGETLAATSASVGLGGKGLNQSVAIARSGGQVRHLGAIGAGDEAMLEALRAQGLALEEIAQVTGALTGSATIFVDAEAENLIVLDPGANARIEEAAVAQALTRMAKGDWALLQNETNMLGRGAALAREAGLRVALAAAPFDAEAVLPLLDRIDLLAVNEIELAQLQEAGGTLPEGLAVLVTLGAEGAEYRAGGQSIRAAAHRVEAVDTTGAGDTVLGAFLARLDAGEGPEAALRYAMAAGALQVTRPGAAAAIPRQDEVEALLAKG
ncbi:ribokinase [Pseudoroseicyclus aestuarii]|uniref:Ribokinase n=1 Tax=Pseudoroseicyclus aestuarii TaxID=1795041 RepID=A0A318T518_9RHOB|nr:ribokinase [Pseudoroseicyclus aestuarii]PYE82371.1 ribokinase [Pseudoroseicyclus aestuarii]